MATRNHKLNRSALQDAAPIQLSVIIACLNEEGTIGSQLEALAAQCWFRPWEVIIADNGSTDGTRSVVERYRTRLPALRVVDASERQGQPYALNRGVAAARGSALAFCDADDVVDEGWVAAVGESLREHEFVAGPFSVARLNEPWALATRPHPQVDGLQHHDHLPHAGGGNLGIRRSVFQEVGGFDETLPYLFDTDFCWRVQEQAGARLTYVPDAVLHIRFRHSLLAIFRQGRNYTRYGYLLERRHGITTRCKPLSWIEVFSLIRMILGQLRRVRCRGEFGRWCWDLGASLGKLESCRSTLLYAQKHPAEKMPTGRTAAATKDRDA